MIVSSPLADFKALEEELDEECARELAAAFLEDAAIAFAGIKLAFASGNSLDLKAQSHALKGCCRTIKALEAENLCNDIESAAIENKLDKVEMLLSELNAAYENLSAFVLSYLND